MRYLMYFKEEIMKARYISVAGLIIASTLLFGCGKEAAPETKEAVQQVEEVVEETPEETIEEEPEKVEEADLYQNTISD